MMLWSIVYVALVQAAPAVVAATPVALVDDVRKLASAPTNEARFDAVTAMLRARNLSFIVESFTIEKPVRSELRTEGRNVVVTIGDGRHEIVMGAHYDAVRLRDGTLSRGAVDNAASSVMLVHLAEALRRETPGARVRIVWFDMEELGLIGSARYVAKHDPAAIKAMVNFDINAYGDTILYGPSAREDSVDLRRTLVETCAAEDINCVGFPQMPPGDDRSFVARGIPTVSVAMLPAIEAHQLWLLMNAGTQSGLAQGTPLPVLQTIHTPDDTIDKVQGEAMVRVLRFARSLVIKLAALASARVD